MCAQLEVIILRVSLIRAGFYALIILVGFFSLFLYRSVCLFCYFFVSVSVVRLLRAHHDLCRKMFSCNNRALVQQHFATFANGFIHMVMICSCLMPSPNIDFDETWQGYDRISFIIESTIIKKRATASIKKLNLQYFLKLMRART